MKIFFDFVFNILGWMEVVLAFLLKSVCKLLLKIVFFLQKYIKNCFFNLNFSKHIIIFKTNFIYLQFLLHKTKNMDNILKTFYIIHIKNK